MAATRRLLAGMLSSQVVAVSLVLAVLMAAGPLAGVGGAGRLQDSAILGGGVVKSFEANLSSAETNHNTTLYIPINASAKVTQAQLNVSGRVCAPFINLSGPGTAAASGEEYGGGV